MQRKIDLEISGSEISLSTRELTAAERSWGAGNRAQGLRWEDGLILLDPLSDDTYSADVLVKTAEKYLPNRQAQRVLQAPLHISADSPLLLGSPSEEHRLDLELAAGDYRLVYEVCLGREVYYVLTLIPGLIPGASALKADGWGLKKDQHLPAGLL